MSSWSNEGERERIIWDRYMGNKYMDKDGKNCTKENDWNSKAAW